VAQLGRPGWHRKRKPTCVATLESRRVSERYCTSFKQERWLNIRRASFARRNRIDGTKTFSRLALNYAEREEISRGLAAAPLSIRKIAELVGRSPSSISREIRRNGGDTHYRAGDADEKAWERSRRPKKPIGEEWHAAVHCRQETAARLLSATDRGVVKNAVSQRQTSPYLARGDLSYAVRASPRGALKRELIRHLRSGREMRHARAATCKGQARYQIVDAVPISGRPPEIEDSSVPGHWEGDLPCGTHIATLVERKSRFTILARLRGKDAATVARAMSR
jgi:IS30 family transposase